MIGEGSVMFWLIITCLTNGATEAAQAVAWVGARAAYDASAAVQARVVWARIGVCYKQFSGQQK